MKIHPQSKMPMTDEELDEVCETFQETSLNGRCFDDSSLSGEPEEFVCAICKYVLSFGLFRIKSS